MAWFLLMYGKIIHMKTPTKTAAKKPAVVHVAAHRTEAVPATPPQKVKEDKAPANTPEKKVGPVEEGDNSIDIRSKITAGTASEEPVTPLNDGSNSGRGVQPN